MNKISIKRIYEPITEDDGFRVLVDRLWPRGISKEKAGLDLWAKTVAPSNELRKEYHKDLEQFEVFKGKYQNELNENKESVEFLDTINIKLEEGNVTFLTATKDMDRNHVTVLVEWMDVMNQLRK